MNHRNKNHFMDFSILYVEDEDDIRAKTAEILVRRTQHVFLAENGARGFELYESEHPDIIITDIRMPVMDGLKLARKIREIDHEVQIVILTAVEDIKNFLQSIEIGINHYLIKPLQLNKIDEVLEKCLRTIRMEKDLHQKNEQIKKLSIAVEQSPTTVFITDLTGRIEYINPKFTELTSYTPQEAIGQDIRMLMNSNINAPEIFQELWKTITSGHDWNGELIGQKVNGEFYWHMTYIAPVRSEQGLITHYVGVMEDITVKKKSEEALRKSEQDLRHRNEIIENDLSNAQIIQRALLPQKPPVCPGLNIDYRYRPLESVGGDYFSFTELREGGLGVFLGDVTGHGVSAALFLALVKALTDRACRKHGLAPLEYFHSLNRELCSALPMNYLTAVYGLFRLNPSEHLAEFHFSKGGHPSPILYRVDDGKTLTLSPKGGLLGVFDDAVFDEMTVELKKGDRLYLYTDGVHETMNEEGEIFGISRLCTLIENVSSMPLSKALDSVIDTLNSYRGGDTARDDIILMGFEVV